MFVNGERKDASELEEEERKWLEAKYAHDFGNNHSLQIGGKHPPYKRYPQVTH